MVYTLQHYSQNAILIVAFAISLAVTGNDDISIDKPLDIHSALPLARQGVGNRDVQSVHWLCDP